MQKEPQLSGATIGLMVATALVFDGIQWILAFILMDWLATIFAYLTFSLWFMLRGIKLMTPKRLSVGTGTLVLELFPWVAALPAITAMVVITILDVRIKASRAEETSSVVGVITPKQESPAEENRKAA